MAALSKHGEIILRGTRTRPRDDGDVAWRRGTIAIASKQAGAVASDRVTLTQLEKLDIGYLNGERHSYGWKLVCRRFMRSGEVSKYLRRMRARLVEESWTIEG